MSDTGTSGEHPPDEAAASPATPAPVLATPAPVPASSWAPEAPRGFFTRLSIQGKLVLAFGLLLMLVTVVAAGGIVGLRAVRRSYESAMEHGLSVERLAGEVLNELLEARRIEKDFLLTWRKEGFAAARLHYLGPHQERVRRIRALVAELRARIHPPIPTDVATRIEDDLVALQPYVDVYADDFEAAVALVGQRGMAEAALDVVGRQIEEVVEPSGGARSLFTLRRRANTYRTKGDPAVRADLVARMGALSAPSRGRRRGQSVTSLHDQLFARYLGTLDELAVIERLTATKLEEFQLAATVVEPLVVDIASKGREIAAGEIKEARSASRRTDILVGFGFAGALLTGLGLAVRLGRQIRTPLSSLARAAEAVGAGDLAARARVESFDEIGRLALTFNAMASQLNTLVTSLEEQVTERRQAEEALSASQRRLQDIIDNSTAVVSVKDLGGRYLLVNRRFEQIFHLTRDKVIGQTDWAFFPADRAEIFRRNDRRAIEAGQAIELEEMAPQDDGLHTYISIKGPLRDEAGRPYAVCNISTDITERKQVEEQLRQSQKMEAIGRLAGGIAHDFNNLLTAINGYSGLMLERMPSSHPYFEHAREIAKAGERAAGLTRQLLAYSRKQVMEPRIWSPNVIVRELETILGRLVGESVKVDIILGADVGSIRVDRGQLEQILLNLAVNAKDAMPDGGRLTIRTASADVGFPGSYERPGAATPSGDDDGHGPQIMLTVSDTGAGMTPEVKARIFEPFFTTKEVGKGTGLGLSVVYGIVKQSGGAIAVESEPYAGTTFRIFFPRVVADPADAGLGGASLLPLLRGGTETVLLVEDEESVRRFAARALEAHGYEVIQAEGGREAMAAFEARSEEIGLVITDVVMPDLGGRALAAFVKSRVSDLPILYISGYAEEAVVSQGMLEAGERFLQKPFSPADLLRQVRDILDERRAEETARASALP